MHRALQRRLLPTDAKHCIPHKRHPQGGDGSTDDDEDSDSGVNMLPPGPITITVTRIIDSSTTATSLSYGYSPQTPSNTWYTAPPPNTMSTVTTTSYVQSYPTTSISSSSSIETVQSLPSPRTSSVPVDTGGPERGESNQGLEPVSGSSAPKKLHSGVLIGVVLACILVAFAIAVFAIRRRYIRRRQRLRKGWAKSKMAHLSLAPEPKIPFSSSDDTRELPMLVKADRRSTSTLGKPETMPFAPPTSYGNDPPSSSSAAAAASQSPTYGPAATKTLVQPITTVVSTFITTLPDELSITVGESVRVLAEYDDGWALCLNTRGEQGMIPMECLDGGYSVISESTSGGTRGAGGNLRRVSSLQPSVGLVGRF